MNIIDQGGRSTSYRVIFLFGNNDNDSYYFNKVEPGCATDAGIITCSINNNTIMFSDGVPENNKNGLFALAERHYMLHLQQDQTFIFIQQIQHEILISDINIYNDLCQIIAEYSVEVPDYLQWKTIKKYDMLVLFTNIKWNYKEIEMYYDFYEQVPNIIKGVLKISDNITLNVFRYSSRRPVRVKSIIIHNQL